MMPLTFGKYAQFEKQDPLLSGTTLSEDGLTVWYVFDIIMAKNSEIYLRPCLSTREGGKVAMTRPCAAANSSFFSLLRF